MQDTEGKKEQPSSISLVPTQFNEAELQEREKILSELEYRPFFPRKDSELKEEEIKDDEE